MARPLRLEYAGATWYVVAKSVARRDVFRDDEDREQMLSLLTRTGAMLRWKIRGYALLRTEMRLIIETPEPNLARGMRQVNGVFTQFTNRKYGRAGALFHGRYKAAMVEKETHLLLLARHMLWSPVETGLVRAPGDWKWSSYRATIGLVTAPDLLDESAILMELGGTGKRARDRFRNFVVEGRDSHYDPRLHVVGQVYLGSEEFRRKIEKVAVKQGEKVSAKKTGVVRPKMREIIAAAAEVFGVTEAQLRRGRRGTARKATAYLARLDGALQLPEIGEALGIREFSASHLASEGERLYEADRGFRRLANRVREKLGVS